MILFCLFTFLQLNQVEFKINSGNPEFYSIEAAKWLPLKSNLNTTHIYLKNNNATVKIRTANHKFTIPSNTFFYLNDLFIDSIAALIDEITLLDIETFGQFKTPEKRDRKKGMVYGENTKMRSIAKEIPFYQERANAVSFCAENHYYKAALLMQKRLLVKYPQLYSQQKEVELLLSLYKKNELIGLAIDEIHSILNQRKILEFKDVLISYQNEILAGL